MGDYTSSDYLAFRKALGASVEQFADLLGMEPDFVRAHEQCDFPIPRPVQRILQNLAQGMQLSTRDDETTVPPSPYMWCEPALQEPNGAGQHPPMVLHTHYPRFSALVIAPHQLGQFKPLIAAGVGLHTIQVHGKPWHILLQFIDRPIHDIMPIVSAALHVTRTKIEARKVPEQ